MPVFLTCLGMLVFVDACLRARDFRAHYTDAGVWKMKEAQAKPLRLSLAFLTSAAWWQGAVLSGMGLSGLWLASGRLPVAAALAAWVFTLSVYNRNAWICNSGDDWLKLTLFWSVWAGTAGGHFALLGQACLVYWTTARRKTDAVWRVSGDAVAKTLALRSMTSRFGLWLKAKAPAKHLRWLTFGTMWVELVAPWLLLAPYPAPAVGAVLLIAFHAGILATMRLGIFQPVCIAALLPAFYAAPPATWVDAIPIALFLYCAAWTHTAHSQKSNLLTLGPLKNFGLYLRLDQVWGMFAPKPLTRESPRMVTAPNIRWVKWHETQHLRGVA